MGRPTAGEQAGDAAQEAAVAGPRDISELLAQALEAYRRTAAGSDGAAPEGADAGELIAQALAAVAPRAEGAKEKTSEAVASGGQDAGRGVPEAQTPAEGGGVVEPSGRRAKGEGVEDWMWEWREWRQVAPGEPCPAGLAYSMDLHAGTSRARLTANLRARLNAAEAARGGGADERPLAPFPPRPDTPPAMVAAGEGAEGEQEAEDEGDEEAYGPGESVLALMYEDDAGPDVYAGMDVDPANAPLRPMPTAVPPPPLGPCERRQCRYHAAEGAHRHRLKGTGQREAGMLASALERYKLQRPRQVAREVALVAAFPDDGQVRCVQLTRRSWVTTPEMSGRQRPRKASPCRCACPWGACWTRQGWRTCGGTKARTWPCGEVGLTLGVASRLCGPSHPRRWGPMRSWWRCPPRVLRSCSARTACC